MAELDLRKSPWHEGFGVPVEAIYRDLYRLTCIVLASPSIDTLGNHVAVELRQEFQESEIGHLLITLAAAIRNAMDQDPSRADYWLTGTSSTVGELIEDEKDPKLKPLEFRESCHKIIHCDSINFDYRESPMRRGGALNPVVYLYGEKGDKSWKAQLELMRFIEVCFQLT